MKKSIKKIMQMICGSEYGQFWYNGRLFQLTLTEVGVNPDFEIEESK